MKKILATLIFPFFMVSCFTYKTVTFTTDEFVKVYEVPGTQNDLFLKANDWMVSTFLSSKSVIEYSDKEEGAILGNYLIYAGAMTSNLGTMDYPVHAKIDVRVKDGKARISIVPEVYRYTEEFGDAFTKEEAIKEMEKLAASFYEALKKESIKF